MLILPESPRHAWLISFWLAICFCSEALLGLLLVLFVSPIAGALGLLLVHSLALLGLLWPQIIAQPYAVWNRLAASCARTASQMLLAICFYTLFVAVGRTGSALKLTRPAAAQSLWVPRSTLAPATYSNLYAGTKLALPSQGWIRSYLSWATHSGNLWAVCLLPFLLLLAVVDVDHKERSFPANIYTLF